MAQDKYGRTVEGGDYVRAALPSETSEVPDSDVAVIGRVFELHQKMGAASTAKIVYVQYTPSGRGKVAHFWTDPATCTLVCKSNGSAVLLTTDETTLAGFAEHERKTPETLELASAKGKAK